MINDRNNQFKGFAFVEFRSEPSAKNALEKLDGKKLDHCILQVSYARPRNN